MMLGAHVLLYSGDPEADRRFFREVLGFAGVDAGGGWLIFRGRRTTMTLPSGGTLGLYQPRHPTALGLSPAP